METVARYPYVEQLRMAHHFVDHYNQQYERKVDGHALGIPFSSGPNYHQWQALFEMTAHYQNMVSSTINAQASFQLIALDDLNGYANLGSPEQL